MGGTTGKLFVMLHGRPLLAHTLRVLQESRLIQRIVLVVRDGEQAQAAALIARHKITKALSPCLGGDSRAESVAKGFAALPRETEWVLVHDGARPCAGPALVESVVAEAKKHGAAAAGVPAWLTVKAVDAERRVRLTLDRGSLWFLQTPQAFRRDWWDAAVARVRIIEKATGNGAVPKPLEEFPDDAALLEWAGFPVRMVQGDAANIKVTTKDDLIMAEAILRNRAAAKPRTASRASRAAGRASPSSRRGRLAGGRARRAE